MATTVRIRNQDKIELDRLQAEILIKTGKKLNHDELLHLLLKHSKEKLIETIIDEFCNYDIDWDFHLNSIGEYGETDASNIDETIYGE